MPATRFPFAWDVTTNRPQVINATGTRTLVNDNRWFVYFVYSTQNPVVGEAVKIVSAPTEFTSLANAQAVQWTTIQSTYPIFSNDLEIRPLYKIIFYNDNSGGGAYNVGCKYSVIREITDIRKAAVTTVATASGSLPASSITVVPVGEVSATNAQSAIEELDSETVKLTGDQTIAGVKTFSSSPIVPTPTTDMQTSTKKYVDDNA